MKLRLLKEVKLKELFEQIRENLDLYRSGNFEFMKVYSANYIEINHDSDESKLLMIDCDNNEHKEVENCINMFKAMGGLSKYLARDKRLWVYLTHTDLLPYTRKRWPIPKDDDNAVKHIQNHFFIIGARGYERDNSASRLWWMASLCKRVDGLSLEQTLTCLLYQYDVRANIIERPTTSQSVQLFSAVLKKLNESYEGDKGLFERDKFRSAMKKLNLIGGIKLLGALEEADIEQILDRCFKAREI